MIKKKKIVKREAVVKEVVAEPVVKCVTPLDVTFQSEDLNKLVEKINEIIANK